jgi:ABC-type glycerol-3-phosphate transport system substrate-binding protein
MSERKLNRRDFLRLSAATATGAIVAACAPSAPQVVEVEKEVAVEKVVIQTVEVEKEVEKQREVLPNATVRWLDFGGVRWGPYHDWVVEQFKDVEPNITLEYEPSASGWYEKLMAQMVAGNAPDIYFGWGWYFGAFASKDQLLDLQPFVDQDFSQETISDFVTQQWDGCTEFGTGVRMCIPKYINWFPWFYNKDLFREHGVDFPDLSWTYDDTDEAVRKLTALGDDGKHKSWGADFTYVLQWSLPPVLHRWGGNKVDPEDNTNCMLDEAGAQAAMEWHRERMWDVDPNPLTQAMQEEGFEGGVFDLGMVGISEDGINNVTPRAERIVDKFEWDLAPPAQGPSRRAAALITDARCIWSGTQVPDAAWALMKYLAEPEALRVMTTMTKQLGVRDSVFDLWPKVLRRFYPVLENVNMEVVHEGIYDLEYSTLDESFRNESEALSLITPMLEKIFVVGDTPTSALGDLCGDIETASKA